MINEEKYKNFGKEGGVKYWRYKEVICVCWKGRVEDGEVVRFVWKFEYK